METEHINNLLIVLLIGSLGLLSFIKISNPLKINQKGNLIFGIFSIVWLTFWFEEWMGFANIDHYNPAINISIHCLQIFAPILLYFSVIFYSIPNFKLKTSHFVHLIVPIAFIILQITQGVLSNPPASIAKAIIFLILSAAFIYGFQAYLQIKRHKQQVLEFASNTQGISLKWLEFIIILLLTNSIFALAHSILADSKKPGILFNAFNLVSVGIIAFQALRQKEIYPSSRLHQNHYVEQDSDNVNTKRKVMSDEELITAKERLTILMIQRNAYLDSEINLLRLSEMAEMTVHQLSYTINVGFGMNFFLYINQYRIAKAKEILASSPDSSKMLAVAFDSGFNSKTTFNTTFKKLTGETPSDFKKKQIGNTDIKSSTL